MVKISRSVYGKNKQECVWQKKTGVFMVKIGRSVYGKNKQECLWQK